MSEAGSAKEFEAQVALLLSLAGYVVSREQLVGHKKVDLYCEEYRLGTLKRIAVECKCWSSVLTQEQLTHIYAGYHPLYDGNLVDEILVVTLNGLAPSAQAMVRETRALSHLTIADLQAIIMDFRSYLTGIVRQFHERGLSQYYVRPQTPEKTDLETDVLEWIESDADCSIAILGGYGIGKTTFARRLAFLLGERALRSTNARLPILIRLGDISAEQSLEGLLGRNFTAANVVRNYTFDAVHDLECFGAFRSTT